MAQTWGENHHLLMSSLVKSLFPVVVPRQEAEGPFSSLKTMTLFDNLPSLQLCSLLHGTWLFESSRKDLTAPFLLPRSQMHFWELLCEFWIVILGTLGFLPGPKPRQLTDTLPHIPWARIPSTLRKACTLATSFPSLAQGRSREDEEEKREGIESQMSG